MTERPLHPLIGNDEPDAGCDAGFELMEEYCEKVQRGEPLDERFAGLIAHIANCVACREDTDGLIAALGIISSQDDTT